MARKSQFRFSLSKEERIVLETQVPQFTSPYCDVIRAQIVLLAAEGLSNDIIASRLDTPRQIVSKWGRNLPLCGRNSGLASVSGPLMLSHVRLSPLKLID